ncbi:MAG: putative ABC transporter permease [Clostridia bacterium]|nr:putative ABC transporter permease [Clostridia bacterium]
MKLIIEIITFFITYSFLGWIIESLYCSFGKMRKTGKLAFVNRGFLTGPMIPIYGVVATIFIYALTPVKHNVFLTMIVGILIADTIEYLTSYGMEKIFHTRWWDYSKFRFNLNGRICLTHTIYWAVLSVVFIKFVHPVVAKGLLTIPHNLKSVVLVICICIFIIDFSDTVVTTLKLKNIEKILHKLANNMVKGIKLPTNINLNYPKAKRILKHYSGFANRMKREASEIKFLLKNSTMDISQDFEDYKKNLNEFLIMIEYMFKRKP